VSEKIFTSGAVPIDSDIASGSFISYTRANTTTNVSVYENSGNESSADYATPTGNYLGLTSDQYHWLLTTLQQNIESGNATALPLRIHGSAYFAGWYNGDIGTAATDETHTIDAMLFFDFAIASGSLLYDSTARLAIGQEFTNITTDITTTGDPVDDRNIPATISTASGFCADGAYHVTSDSNNAGKLTLDRDRALLGVVIEGDHYKTGDPSAPDEYLLCQWNCDSDTLDVYNATDGSTVTRSGADYDSDGTKGKGCELLDANNDTIDFVASDGNNINLDTGTIEFDFKQTEIFNTFRTLFILGSSATAFALYSGSTSTSYIFRFAGSSYTISGSGGAGTNVDIADGQWHHLKLTWEKGGKAILWFDGEATDDDTTLVDSSPSPTNTTFHLGCWYSSGDAIGGIIDNFKIYSAPILPYGSFIPGDIIHSDEYSRAHSDVTFFWDGSDCTSSDVQIGGVLGTLGSSNTGGTTSFPTSGGVGDGGYFDNEDRTTTNYLRLPVTSNDLVDPNSCTIGVWVSFPSTPTARSTILSFGVDANNFYELYIDGGVSNAVVLRSMRNGVSDYSYNASYPVAANTEYFIEARLTADSVGVFMDSILMEEEATTGVFVGDISYLFLGINYTGTSYGCDCHISTVTITSSPSTPSVSTINGIPVNYPDVRRG